MGWKIIDAFKPGAVTGLMKKSAIPVLHLAGKAMVAEITREIGVQGYGTPSQPGNPPYKQTGELQAGIRYEIDAANLIVYVLSDAPYSTYLEFGTSRMDARPFMHRGTLGYAEKYGLSHFVGLTSADYRGGPAEEFVAA